MMKIIRDTAPARIKPQVSQTIKDLLDKPTSRLTTLKVYLYTLAAFLKYFFPIPRRSRIEGPHLTQKPSKTMITRVQIMGLAGRNLQKETEDPKQ